MQKLSVIVAITMLGMLQNVEAQQAHDLELVYHWENTTIVPSSFFGNPYNEVWGYWKNGREYAIIGSTDGTHVFDVTDSAQEHMVDYVPAPVQGGDIVHRDYDDYDDYLYAVCDEGNGTSTLQIMDLRALPDSVELVYDSHVLFSTAHNIFIDTASARLYVCGVRNNDATPTALRVFSIANPTNPVFLWNYDVTNYVHDIYVRNDTAYLNSGSEGLLVVDFTGAAPIAIGSLDTYPYQGYNHSGWLTEDGNTYIMCDETHGYKIKILDVSDPTDPTVISTFEAVSDSNSIPHNVMIKDSLAFISYYYEGLQVFNIADPTQPQRVAWYDTYPDETISFYEGAWGIYCYLPSGKLLVSDMQTGLYVLKFPDSFFVVTPIDTSGTIDTTDTSDTTGVFIGQILPYKDLHLTAYPNPVNDLVQLQISSAANRRAVLFFLDIQGKLLREEEISLQTGLNVFPIGLGDLKYTGLIYVLLKSGNTSQTINFIKEP